MHRFVATLVACALLGVASAAAAGGSTKLTYVRGEGAERCGAEHDLRAAVAARLGHDPFVLSAGRTIVAGIARARGGLRAWMQILDADGIVHGERSLQSASSDCGQMLKTLALAISIAVDDFVEEPPALAAPSPERGTSEVAARSDVEPPARSSTRGDPSSDPAGDPFAPRSSRGEMDAALGPSRTTAAPKAVVSAWAMPIGSFGVAPAAALGVTAGVGVRYGSVSFGAEGRADLPATGSVARGARVTTRLSLASLTLCAHGRFRLFACGLGAIGSFHEAGRNIVDPAEDAALFAGAGARLGASIPVSSRIFFLAHADALAALTPHRIAIDGARVFAMWPVALSVGIGAGSTF